jgi:AcrR family transcriptional regulator
LETERSILESAYAIMASDGLAAATIDAVARHSKVSKMTIYKWWPSREALLIDAFLRQAAAIMTLPPGKAPLAALKDHAGAYVDALAGDFGKVQLAVIAECIANTGSATLFSERYLRPRRAVVLQTIAAGQADGSITRSQAAGDLYDRIYGTLFYQYVFDFRALSRAYAQELVTSVLTGAGSEFAVAT